MSRKTRLAVVLFNLGGPDETAAIEPFLFNLFNDKAIIGLPAFLRYPLAKTIARRRAPFAKQNYDLMGGGSPILRNTQEQAAALQGALGDRFEARTFIAMRYWKPFARETAEEVKAFAPDKVALLPLYPQFSTTTTGSSFKDWRRAAKAVGLDAPTSALCCYYGEPGFVAAHADGLETALGRAEKAGVERIRVLFSAHGLPEKVIRAGDPYQWQIEETAARIAGKVRNSQFDWRVSYQSRVGPMRWIGPATDAEIRRAGSEGVGLIVVPIAFVSEHVETLVELDIEYGKLAREAGAPYYDRVAALGAHAGFIAALAGLAARAAEGEGVMAFDETAACPKACAACPRR